MNAEHTESRRPTFGLSCGADLTDQDRRNLRRYNRWLISFAAAFVASVVLLVREGVVEAPALRWILALTPDALGVMSVIAYVRFLRYADELVRKVHLEATAIGFGAGVVFILGYALAELAGAPELAGTEPAAVMLFGAGLGQWLGMRRYR